MLYQKFAEKVKNLSLGIKTFTESSFIGLPSPTMETSRRIIPDELGDDVTETRHVAHTWLTAAASQEDSESFRLAPLSKINFQPVQPVIKTCFSRLIQLDELLKYHTVASTEAFI